MIGVMMRVHGNRDPRNSIQSLIKQEKVQWQLVIGKHRVTDNVNEWIDELSREFPQITSFHYSPTLDEHIYGYRPGDHLNEIATFLTNCEYLINLDSDDQLVCNMLFELKKYLDSHQDYVIVGCQYLRLGPTGKVSSRFTLNPLTNRTIRYVDKYRQPFLSSGTLIRNSIFQQINGFNSSLSYLEDRELFHVIRKFGNCRNLFRLGVLYGVNYDGKETRNLLNGSDYWRSLLSQMALGQHTIGDIFWLREVERLRKNDYVVHMLDCKPLSRLEVLFEKIIEFVRADSSSQWPKSISGNVLRLLIRPFLWFMPRLRWRISILLIPILIFVSCFKLQRCGRFLMWRRLARSQIRG